MRFILVLTAFSAAFAQRPEVRGTVLEPGINQPVADAEVTLEYYGPEHPRIMPSPFKSALTTKTDPSGAFAFRPDDIGYYYIRANKEGYNQPGLSIGGPSNNQECPLTAEAPTKEIHLYLVRPGQLSGRVIDEETRKPIANVKVYAGRLSNFAGRHMYLGSMATTDANGEFTAINLAPGDYVAEIRPQKAQKERILTKFTEEDLRAVDQDFPDTFWPGGHGEESALPVPLTSGGKVNVGEIAVKKAPAYRVHVHFPATDCTPAETMMAFEYHQDATFAQSTLDLAQTPCGKDVLVTGFRPGAYRLIFMVNGRKGENREMASVPFLVSDKNVEITANLEHVVNVAGSFVAADGAKLPDLSKATVWLDPIGGLRTMDLATPVPATEKGTFQAPAFPVSDHRMVISGIGAGHYIKEIRYNGIAVKGNILSLNNSAMSHSLTIVLDDKPAAITGTVMKGDQPVSRPFLILAKWPLPANEFFLPTAQATGDEKGKFQIGGLAPGEYRIVAMASSADFNNRPPNSIQRALAGAAKIEVGANAFQNVTLEITDLR